MQIRYACLSRNEVFFSIFLTSYESLLASCFFFKFCYSLTALLLWNKRAHSTVLFSEWEKKYEIIVLNDDSRQRKMTKNDMLTKASYGIPVRSALCLCGMNWKKRWNINSSVHEFAGSGSHTHTSHILSIFAWKCKIGVIVSLPERIVKEMKINNV